MEEIPTKPEEENKEPPILTSTIVQVGPNGDYGWVMITPEDIKLHPEIFHDVNDVNMDEYRRKKVFIHVSAISDIRRGKKIETGTELVIKKVEAGEKGLKVTDAQTKESYDEERKKRIAIIKEKERREQEEEARRILLEEERRKWEPTVKKLQEIQDIVNLSGLELLHLREAITAVLPPEKCVLLYISSGYVDTEFDESPWWKAEETIPENKIPAFVEQDPRKLIAVETRMYYICTDQTSEWDNYPGEISVLVYLSAKAKIVFNEPSYEPRESIPKPGRQFNIFRVVESSTEELKSWYRVTPEDAQIIWGYCEWWKRDLLTFSETYETAQKILRARELWLRHFPDIPPGDLSAVLQANNLDPSFLEIFQDYRDPGFFGRALNTHWIKQVHWDIPDVYSRPVDDLIKERFRLLRESAKNGDEESLEILREDSFYYIRQDIWESINKGALGPRIRSDFSLEPYEKFLETLSIESENSPNYEAYWVDEEGKEHVIVQAIVVNPYNGKSFYKVRIGREGINTDPFYIPGTLKWRPVSE